MFSQIFRFGVISLAVMMFGANGAFGQEVGLKKRLQALFPAVKPASRKLMEEYLLSLQAEAALDDAKQAIENRQRWHRVGSRYTPLLLARVQKAKGEDLKLLVRLLGGTHDDRAAVSLRKKLEAGASNDVRPDICSALAELGYYTRYHSALLLEEVKKARATHNDTLYFDAALALSTILNREATWAQDQLYELKLVDGGLSEKIGPVLKLRDRYLKTVAN